jgi:Tol biopolymer transport system component
MSLLLFSVMTAPVAAGDEIFTIDQVLASPFPSSLVASADGQRIAWIFNLRGVTNLWVAEGPDFTARRLTSFDADDGRPLRCLGFVPDGRSLFMTMSSRYNPDHRALGSGPSQLYQVAWSGGEPQVLAETAVGTVSPAAAKVAWAEGGDLWVVTAGESPVKVVSMRGSLSQPSWSPDGTQLLASVVRGNRPNRYAFIVVYKLEQGSLRYIDASVYLDQQPVWSPDGRQIAFMRRLTSGHQSILIAKQVRQPDPWEIRVADATSGRSERVWRSPASDHS